MRCLRVKCDVVCLVYLIVLAGLSPFLWRFSMVAYADNAVSFLVLTSLCCLCDHDKLFLFLTHSIRHCPQLCLQPFSAAILIVENQKGEISISIEHRIDIVMTLVSFMRLFLSSLNGFLWNSYILHLLLGHSMIMFVVNNTGFLLVSINRFGTYPISKTNCALPLEWHLT